ncbi:alpha/beta hydrolase [Nocardia sp. NPDC048505]|uniref:alpha/beta fold hydrolase n=1 Tax=unclassified Nocardia TaxID=2637762 RepID=UPI0033C1E539
MSENTTAAPRYRRRTRVLVAAAGVTVLAIMAWLALRDTAPVGHFTSAEGYRRFQAAYDRAMRELPSPDRVLDLRTDYGVVRVYRFDGARPEAAPLVLLPGRAAATPVWADNLASLRALRTVYTVDLLGEPGASIQARPIENDADQARWLHQALRQLPHDTVDLVGMSIGGWTATNLAVREPAGIGRVILLDPAMTFAPMPFETIVRSIPASVRWLPRSWRDSFNRWVAGGAPTEDVPIADMIEAGMQTYALHLPAATQFGTEQLARARMPFLVLLAGESVMHDANRAAEQARETLGDATVLVYPTASHAINGEYPDRIAADIASFLARA